MDAAGMYGSIRNIKEKIMTFEKITLFFMAFIFGAFFGYLWMAKAYGLI